MFFQPFAFAFVCVILHCSFLNADSLNGKSREVGDGTLRDDHTFVALIDIVFTDGSKRTCTGAIIHDNVVITAAHCFCKKGDSSTKPELTTSFVVIGTKKMFDTGYEQYLPIERILTHPKFRGWTADLSLVYTFAAMTSDKPGKIIPLAGEKMSNPVDSNVTVFSWGHCKDKDNSLLTTTAPCPEDSAEDMNDQEPIRVTAGLNSKRSRAQEKTQPPQNQPEQKKQYPAPKQNLRQPLRYKTEPKKTQQSRYKTESRTVQKDLFHQYPILQQKVRNKQIDDRLVEPKKEATAKRLSRYLTSSEDNVETNPRIARMELKNLTYETQEIIREGAEKYIRGRLVTRPSSEPIDSIKTMYKNWRRLMDSLQNKLTVEVFGFVNMAACKKIVEGSNLPAHYEIKNGEVACYSSDEHYITEEDSGAPAIRHGQLVAVTVGGAECDGDHVGVGVKMSCYCSWIADNLPGGGANINCCKNCCNANNEDSSRNMFRNRNKYLV